MNALEKIKSAQSAAQVIVAGFQGELANAPDAVEARKAELSTLKKDELIARILELEKPKGEAKVKVEDVARALMESTECAVLTWSDIAEVIQASGFGEKTSGASIASYASKRKDEWNIVPRERLKFNAADLMAAAGM